MRIDRAHTTDADGELVHYVSVAEFKTAVEDLKLENLQITAKYRILMAVVGLMAIVDLSLIGLALIR